MALALLAHPDDAGFLCAAALARLHAEHGYAVHIATCTPGDAGSPDLPADEIAAIRREEAQQAAACLDARYHCLELRDLKVYYAPDGIQGTIDLMRRVNPTRVLTHPRPDHMQDHEQCHLLARVAIVAGAGARPVQATRAWCAGRAAGRGRIGGGLCAGWVARADE